MRMAEGEKHARGVGVGGGKSLGRVLLEGPTYAMPSSTPSQFLESIAVMHTMREIHIKYSWYATLPFSLAHDLCLVRCAWMFR
jgi:hypothetical protein